MSDHQRRMSPVGLEAMVSLNPAPSSATCRVMTPAGGPVQLQAEKVMLSLSEWLHFTGAHVQRGGQSACEIGCHDELHWGRWLQRCVVLC